MRGYRHPRRGLNAPAARRHDPNLIKPRFTRFGHEIIGRCKHLKRSGDIKQLHGGISQDLDGASRIWRRTRGLWYHRHKMPRQHVPVHPRAVRERSRDPTRCRAAPNFKRRLYRSSRMTADV